MQTRLTFPAPPLPSADFMADLTNKLKSLASSRMGDIAPDDVQDGEIWVKTDSVNNKWTVMVRIDGIDVPLLDGTAANATQWTGKSQWIGAESTLPASRDANTIYLVY